MSTAKPALKAFDSELYFDQSQTINSLFLEQVRTRPAKIAIIEDERRLSYLELDRCAGGLAAALQREGVQKGDRVALIAGRGIETVAAQLAVMALGAAFVPLDPAMPQQHLADVIDAACPSAVLCRKKDRKVAASVVHSTCPVILLEGDPDARAGRLEPDHQTPETQIGPNDMAYVIYTSGSTGQPKGVMAAHRGVCRLVRGQHYADLGPDQVMLNMAAVGFDASIGEVYSALLNGGTLVIMPDATPSLDRIADVIARDGVTVAYITAGLFHIIAEQRVEILAPLQQVFPCGDVLSETHVRAVRRAHPNLTVINGYGPTENTVLSCCFAIDDSWTSGPIPIGRGLRHDSQFILDEHLRPVPDGQTGQLAIGGAGVALGYLGRPDLTKAAFVTLDLTLKSERVYLTGDLVQRDPDGVIWFHGRMDRQIKINGQRVELDAVEHALRADIAVKDAVAIAVPGTGGLRQIAAFVIPAKGMATGDALGAEVKQRLRQKLPAAAIPSTLTLCERFPLSTSGKIDRKAMIGHVPKEPRPVRKADAGSLSSVIRHCWEEILDRPITDDTRTFFDHGGTSLQLIQVHALLQTRLGQTFDIAKLFEAPRIRELELALSVSVGAPDPVAASRERMAKRRASSRIAR